MHNTEIIKLLQVFSEKEIKIFKKFVAQKEYNKKRFCKELLVYIYRARPDFEGEKLDKEKAQAFLKKKKDDIDDGYLRQMLSILSQYAQDFLIENELQEQEIYKFLLLKKALDRRGFEKMPRKAMQYIKGKKKVKQTSSILDFHEEYLTISYKHEIATQKNNQQKEVFFSDVAKAFDKYTIVQELKNACVLPNNQRLLATDNHEIDIDNLIKRAEKQEFKQGTLFELYYLLLLILTAKEVAKNWKKLLNILKNEAVISDLNKADRKTIILLVINFCNKKLRSGDFSYYLTQFELYQIMAEKGDLFEQGKLPTFHYKNIVRLACRANAFEDAQNFIDDYKNKVAQKYRENYYHLNLAALFFYKNDYDKTLKNLVLVGDLERQDHLNVEMLFLKTYYALLVNGDENYDEPLRDRMNAFETYLRRNKKAIASHWAYYNNFLDLFETVFQLYSERNLIGNDDFETKKAILVQQIESCQKLVDKKWLLKQLVTLV
ncbi:MAG: hypothetical protein ACPG5B_17820 [Chitinophagales bacterium]